MIEIRRAAAAFPLDERSHLVHGALFRQLPRLEDALDLGYESRNLRLKHRIFLGCFQVVQEYLEHARQTEPFDPSTYEDEDPEMIEMERKADLCRCAADLLLVERAKEWLLGE